MNEGVVVSAIGALETEIKTDLVLETILATENTTTILDMIEGTTTMIEMIIAMMSGTTKLRNLQKF